MITKENIKSSRIREIQEIGTTKSGHMRVKCLCRCGNIFETFRYCIESGWTKSCGCLARELSSKRLTTHGETRSGFHGSPEYVSWAAMLSRCMPKAAARKYYFERGIIVCERWKKFENFLSDMGRKPNKSYSIDRINNNDGYRPGNCRWATAKEQALNRRNLKKCL